MSEPHLVADLGRLLAMHAEDWTEEDKQLCRDTAARLVTLLGEQALGIEVQEELAIAMATARNIAVAATWSGARLIATWLKRASATVIAAILTG